jgi:hypothetical protein
LIQRGDSVEHYITVRNTGTEKFSAMVKLYVDGKSETQNYLNPTVSPGGISTITLHSNAPKSGSSVKFTYVLYADYALKRNVELHRKTVTISLKAPTGKLTVKSNPDKADIYIDGIQKGRTNNDLVLPSGKYTVKISKTGYEDSVKTVTVPEHSSTTHSVTLKKRVTAGTLIVRSDPSGATVLIGGSNSGTTPLTLDKQAPGKYSIRIQKSGYADYTTSATVVAGQTTTVRAGMTDLPTTTTTVVPTTGTLSITSSPTGATVYVDGVSKGATSKTLSGVSAGTHTVRVVKSGYQEYSETVRVTAGRTTTVSASLIKNGASSLAPVVTTTTIPVTTTKTTAVPTGTLSIRSSPTGATVYVDDVSKGATSKTLSGVSAGTHTVRVVKSGYQEYSETVRVTAGRTTTVSASLIKNGASSLAPVVTTTTIPVTTTKTTAVPTGTLSIRSSPTGATVYVDGVSKGITSKILSSVSAGTHTVRVVKSGYQEYSETVEVAAGKTTKVSAKMVKNGASSLAPVVTTTRVPVTTTAAGIIRTTTSPSSGRTGTTPAPVSEPAAAEILAVDFPAGSFPYGSRVSTAITLKNTGNDAHTFYAQSALIHPSGTTIRSAVQAVSLQSGESKQVTLASPVTDDAYPGSHQVTVTVWGERNGSPENELASADSGDSRPVMIYEGTLTLPGWEIYPKGKRQVVVDGTTYTAIPATSQVQGVQKTSWLILDRNNQPVRDLTVYKKAAQVAEVSGGITSRTESNLREIQDEIKTYMAYESGIKAAIYLRNTGSHLLGAYALKSVTGGLPTGGNMAWKEAARVASEDIANEYVTSLNKGLKKIGDPENAKDEFDRLLWATTVTLLTEDEMKIGRAADIISRHDENQPWTYAEIGGENGYYQNWKDGVVRGMRDMEMLSALHPDAGFSSQMKDIGKNFVAGATADIIKIPDVTDLKAVIAAGEVQATYEMAFSDIEQPFKGNAEEIFAAVPASANGGDPVGMMMTSFLQAVDGVTQFLSGSNPATAK